MIEQEGRFEIAGIIDRVELVGEKVLGYEIIDSDENLSKYLHIKNALITIGQIKSPDVRIKLFTMCKKLGFELPVIISPLAYVSKYAFVDAGSIVMHHALVNAGAKVGKNCIINSKALIEHDASIGDNCHISTGAVVNGGANVDENSFFGSNAVSKEGAILSGFIKAGSVAK